MKIFLVHNNFCLQDMTGMYESVEQAKQFYTPETLIVSAPDTVFVGWGYLNGEFIRPDIPEGWLYDENTGVPYDPNAPEDVSLERQVSMLKSKLEASVKANQMLEDCLVEMAEIVYA